MGETGTEDTFKDEAEELAVWVKHFGMTFKCPEEYEQDAWDMSVLAHLVAYADTRAKIYGKSTHDVINGVLKKWDIPTIGSGETWEVAIGRIMTFLRLSDSKQDSN